jgi:hypothetical protein
MPVIFSPAAFFVRKSARRSMSDLETASCYVVVIAVPSMLIFRIFVSGEKSMLP